MKVLWLSNIILSDKDSGITGTWLDAMAEALVRSGLVTLGNISTGTVPKIMRQDHAPIRQWVVPTNARLKSNGLPDDTILAGITNAVEDFKPDLVHVWGTESYWGLLTARKLIQQVSLLDTQGLKFSIAKVYHGGLSAVEQLACVGLKEILRRSMIYQGKRRFDRWGQIEKEIIAHHQNISVQTEWLESQVRAVNHTCKIFRTDFALRTPFCTTRPWQYSGNYRVFCSSAYPAPFKGLHVAIRAVSLLKSHLPNVKLCIAGALQNKGMRQDGYIAWLNRAVRKLRVESNVEWLGPLAADQIVEELQNSAAALFPSYVEGYCLALAEAMMIGVPSIVSYAGGMPSLCENEKSALFFSAGDEIMCAHQLGRIINDRELAESLSKNAREIAWKRNDPDNIVSRQLEIYRQIIHKDNR